MTLAPILFILQTAATKVPSVAAQIACSADPANCAADGIVSWICSNQTLVTWVLALLLAHGGLSVTSAILKKMGFIGDPATIFGYVVKIVRVLAVDVTPPQAVVVQQAQKIVTEHPEVLEQAPGPIQPNAPLQPPPPTVGVKP